jgi:muconate cycloisomerase
MGGTYAAQRIAVLAEEAGVPLYAGGQVATSVGAATAAHFFAATQHAAEGDFQLGPDGWLAADIVKTPLEVKDGRTVVPMDSPGIGVTLEEPKLEALTVDS